MVLKKTNCPSVNSGNTMKKFYLWQYHINKSQTTHVVKLLKNIPPRDPCNKWKKWEVNLAAEYFDDSGLRPSHIPDRYIPTDYQILYSLNKKNRWLLKDIITDAVCYNEKLLQESFKVTLVNRAVAYNTSTNIVNCSDINFYCNVTEYYDSHLSTPAVFSSRPVSFRQSLLQKGLGEPEGPDHRAVNLQRRQQGHNQRNRVLMRKSFKGLPEKRSQSRMKPLNVLERTEGVPEIRYEWAEVQEINSSSLRKRVIFKEYGDPLNVLGKPRFRGPKKDQLSWYILPTSDWKSLDDPDCLDEEEEEVESSLEEYRYRPASSAQREFSLLDLVSATQSRRRRGSRRQVRREPCAASGRAGTMSVNTASSQAIRKRGKGAAIWVEGAEARQDGASSVGMTLADDAMDSDVDSSRFSDDGDDEDRMRDVASPAVALDHQQESDAHDRSFCTCIFPKSDFCASHLRNLFGKAVQFGKCNPFTVRFDMSALSSVVKLVDGDSGDSGKDEWWLVCQVGNEPKDKTTGNTLEAMAIVNMKLHNCHDDSQVSAANLKLRQLLKDIGRASCLSIYVLLICVCKVVYQHSTQGSEKEKKLTTGFTVSKQQQQPQAYIPFELYTDPVKMYSVRDVYLLLQSSNHMTTRQMTSERDLDNLNAVQGNTFLVDKAECTVCFDRYDDKRFAARENFRPFVTLTTCGHTFCRQCWQHQLVSTIFMGQTTLNCMEFKCDQSVDPVLLMALTPQWVFARWQHLQESKVVETHTQWKWCPGPYCDRLAFAERSTQSEDSDKPRGRPVVCQCQKRWCVDCGLDAHWPANCDQFKSYVNMLKQNGEEDGRIAANGEISFVYVKHCPGCHYPMQKSGGCSHMICTKCRRSFCWECLRDWSEHATDWRGCTQKQEQTVELNNEKVYPLPIEFYKKAVACRYIWKGLDRKRQKTIMIYCNLLTFVRNKKGGKIAKFPDIATKRVTNALFFLRKAYMLLELAYVLLSNTSRHHLLMRPLLADLQVLILQAERVTWHLSRQKKRVLQTSEALEGMTTVGERCLLLVCRQCHRLSKRIHKPLIHKWLLEADHETFVSYK